MRTITDAMLFALAILVALFFLWTIYAYGATGLDAGDRAAMQSYLAGKGLDVEVVSGTREDKDKEVEVVLACRFPKMAAGAGMVFDLKICFPKKNGASYVKNLP